MSLPVVVSFYTPEYRQHAERLVASCRMFDLPAIVTEIESAGSWIGNCAKKPQFILERITELESPVLWLDADAVVRARPELLDEAAFDFAICRGDPKRDKRWGPFNSGTAYFSPVSATMIQSWANLCATDPRTIDQVLLFEAWERHKPLTAFLPQGYCKIFDQPWFPNEPSHVVIEHFQASRQMRKMVHP